MIKTIKTTAIVILVISLILGLLYAGSMVSITAYFFLVKLTTTEILTSIGTGLLVAYLSDKILDLSIFLFRLNSKDKK